VTWLSHNWSISSRARVSAQHRAPGRDADNSGRVNVECHGNVRRARASGELTWYMEGKPGTYLEHSDKPLEGTRVPAHSGLGEVSGMERTIASNLSSPNCLVPATSDHPGTRVSRATQGTAMVGTTIARYARVRPQPSFTQANPNLLFFFSIYFRSMSCPGHMLPPKPVRHEFSHETSAYFLTCLVAASEVSSIPESRISGSSLGGNVEEMGCVLSWSFRSMNNIQSP